MQNEQVKENNAERKRAMAKERSRRFREKKRLPTAVHGTKDRGQKKLLVSVAAPPASVRVPSQRLLASRVASVTDLLEFALKLRETPVNLS